MNEEMMTTGFTAGDTATGPTAGFDPVMKMRAKLKDLKGLVAPGNKLADPTVVKKKKVKEDWKPEIEVIDTKKRKKEAEKKRKEAADSLPPHLKLDVMRRAFAKTNEARNTRADANTLRSVSTPRMQGKKGNVNLKGRSVTGGAAMSGMNIRAAGGLGKSKPKDVDGIVARFKKQVKSDRLAATKQRAREKAGVSEAIAPSPQEIQVHKKISMLQQKLAQLRKKTVNNAAKGQGSAAEQTVEEGVVDRYAPKNNLLQYRLDIPGVGETVVYANSPAELRQKMRILINPRFRGDVKIERILPYDAYKFFTDKRTKALKRK